MERIGNPWLGLASYEEKDEYRFKGRSKDVECVLTKLQQNDCLVCYAESGTGKSSLINAGLSPAMRRNRMFPIRIKFTTEEYEGKNIPLKKEDETIDFDQLILKKINQSLEIYKQNVLEIYDFGEDFAINFEQIEQYKTNINNGISSLWWKLRTEAIRITFGEYDYIPVLIFDQFEEIFSATWKKEFFQWLEILMKDVCPDSVGVEWCYKERINIPNKKFFKLLLSLRSEYIGELDYWCGQITYIPQIQKNRYFLKSLTREQAIEVISAQDQNDKISMKLKEEAVSIVDSILNASGKEKGVSDINEVPSVALSLVCYILYNEWSKNESFSLNKYNLDELIYDFYRSQLNSIGVADNHRHVLETVLISSQKKRLRIPISDPRLKKIGIQKYLESLLSLHILKCENINDEKYIELVHDCLMEAIFEKSKEERDKREIKRRIIRGILITAVVLLCVFVGYTIWTQYKVNKLHDVIYSRFMIEKANNLSETGYPYLATNMILSGLSQIVDISDVQSCKDDVLLEIMAEAEAVLRRINVDPVIIDVKKLNANTHHSFIRTIAFSNDGKNIVTTQQIHEQVSKDSVSIKPKEYVAIWETKTGACINKEEKHVYSALYAHNDSLILLDESFGVFYPVSSVSLHPDEKKIIYATGNENVSVVDLNAKTLVKKIDNDRKIYSTSISPNGTLIVASGFLEDSIIVRDYKTSKLKRIIGVHSPTMSVDFITDETIVCVGNKGIEIIDVQLGISKLLVEESFILESSISSDGRYIAIISTPGYSNTRELKIFSIKTGSCIYSMDNMYTKDKRYNGAPNLVSFSPDGKKIAITSTCGNYIWIVDFLSFQEVINEEIKRLKEHEMSNQEYEEFLKLKKYFKINYKN